MRGELERIADAVDTVERLRSMSMKKYAPSWAAWVQDQCTAAANEIERLREALAAAEADATQLASALCGKYSNVLAPFAVLMAAELHANSRKGDRPGWLSMSREVALLEIYWHTAKLSAAVKNNDAAAIREHSADVANMAMMLLDVCGGLIGGDDGRK